jgi:hypothetical protein
VGKYAKFVLAVSGIGMMVLRFIFSVTPLTGKGNGKNNGDGGQSWEKGSGD